MERFGGEVGEERVKGGEPMSFSVEVEFSFFSPFGAIEAKLEGREKRRWRGKLCGLVF